MLFAVQFNEAGDGEDPLLNASKKLVVMLPIKLVTCSSAVVVLELSSLDGSTDCDDVTADPVVTDQMAAATGMDVTFIVGLTTEGRREDWKGGDQPRHTRDSFPTAWRWEANVRFQRVLRGRSPSSL